MFSNYLKAELDNPELRLILANSESFNNITLLFFILHGLIMNYLLNCVWFKIQFSLLKLDPAYFRQLSFII
ncbi:hypothetical protein METHB2_300005 [Candidatus Methylobacter favarea]|uniref:Uncharacterized protein n=1 Tax=Candidatus Methylobacter favarea TaxID=2707345 RepID=A0A8S0XGC9_9GAMM|nr:hypothetical protein METHB2_300005 [Candidatus Methylobacter favarea]